MSITAQQILATAPARFRPEKARDIHTTFHFMISGDENFTYSIVLDKETCVLHTTLVGIADCEVITTAKNYIDLETGKLNPQAALLLGKVKVSSIAKMQEFAKCFRRFEGVPVETTVPKPPKPKRKGHLEGVKILDFTKLLPGPMATMLLADMGADVIKIEDSHSPDYIRSFEPMIGGASAFYFALNRNKRSLAVNFLLPEGKALILDLVKSADVLIEQYRPGTMAQFGLDYETLRAIQPKLIYLSLTGYGQGNSLSHCAGHDINYIATAGLLSTTGSSQGEPVIPGFQLADVAGGSYMTMNAITTALYSREINGQGEYIDIAMTDAVLPFMALPLAVYQATGSRKVRGKMPLSGGMANYNVYKCGDGRYIVLGALEPKFWGAFCTKINKPEWAGNLLGSIDAQEQLKELLQDFFLQKSRNEWIAFFEGVDVCISPMNELDELADNSYLKERNAFIDLEVEGKTIKTIRQPIHFASMVESENWIAPALGEDSLAILQELNLSETQIKDLIQKNIVHAI